MIKKIYFINIYWVMYLIAVIFFGCSLLFAFYPNLSFAQTIAAWSIPTATPSGMKIAGDTYYVTNENEFLYSMNRNSSIIIELMNNIDLSGKTLTPFDRSYSLTINGNGYTIMGVDIDASESKVGLIGETSSTLEIYNLNLQVDIDHKYTSSRSYVGGFVGRSTSTLIISGCTVSGSITDTDTSKYNYIGGFVGESDSSVTVENCINYSDISVKGNSAAGGIIGRANSSSSTISQCANFGDISSIDYYAAGLIGLSYSTKTLSNCFNCGDISSDSSGAGGLVGYLSEDITIQNCYNTGDISVGDSSSIGGLVAYAYSTSTIKYCYSTGTLSSDKKSKTTSNSSSKQIAQYEYSNKDDDSMERFWPDSQDLSKFPTSDTYVGGGNSILTFGVKKVTTTTSGFIPSLCGGDAPKCTNSYCYQSSNTNYDLMKIDVVFAFNDTQHNLGTFTISSDKKISVDDKRNDVFRTNESDIEDTYNVTLDENDMVMCIASYTINVFGDDVANLISKGIITFPSNALYGSSRDSLQAVYPNAITCTISGSSVTLTPWLMYNVHTKNYKVTYRNCKDTTKVLTLSLPSVTTTFSGIKLSSKSDIKNKSSYLGSAYVTNSNINNGYPVLKEFYWMYS